MNAKTNQGPNQTGQHDPFQAQPEGIPATLAACAKTNQIIRAALIMGTIIIGIVMMVIADDEQKDATLFLLIGGAMWVGTLIASFVVPSLMTAHAKPTRSAELAQVAMDAEPTTWLPIELQRSMALYSTRKLVQAALLEGSCVINLIFYSMAPSPWFLVMAGINIGVMLITFPSLSSLRDFVVSLCEPDGSELRS